MSGCRLGARATRARSRGNVGLSLWLRQEGMLPSRADKEPQLASRALCSHVDRRLVMPLRDAALGPSRPGHGGAAEEGGAARPQRP